MKQNSYFSIASIYIVIFALSSCKDKEVATHSIYRSHLDSVKVSEYITLPRYDRFNFKTLYTNGIYILFAEQLGDCIALDANGQLLWKLELSETSGDPSGVFQINNFTDYFGLHFEQLFFYQGNNSLKLYDLNGQPIAEYTIEIPSGEKVVDIASFSLNKFALVTISLDENENKIGKIYTYSLKNQKLEHLYSNSLKQGLNIKISTDKGRIYYLEDLSDKLLIIENDSQTPEVIQLIKNSRKNYIYQPPYQGKVDDYLKLSKTEKLIYQNDGYRDFKIIEGNTIIHYKILNRTQEPLYFKELITVQKKSGDYKQFELKSTMLNLDAHENIYNFIKYGDEVYLKVSPLEAQ